MDCLLVRKRLEYLIGIKHQILGLQYKSESDLDFFEKIESLINYNKELSEFQTLQIIADDQKANIKDWICLKPVFDPVYVDEILWSIKEIFQNRTA